jgi:hypothetical protein
MHDAKIPSRQSASGWALGPPEIFPIYEAATHSSEVDTIVMDGAQPQDNPLPPPNTRPTLNWIQRAVLWALRIRLPQEPRPTGIDAAKVQWFMLALGVGRNNDDAVAVSVLALALTVFCFLVVSFTFGWQFVRLIFVSLSLAGVAYTYLVCAPKHRVSLLTTLSTLATSLSILRVIICGASFTVCYQKIIPVNAPYTPTLGKVLFDPHFDVFYMSLFQQIGANPTMNTTETISIQTVNQSHCVAFSITAWGSDNGFGFDVKESVSQVNASAVLAARKQILGGVVEGLWELSGIEHNQSDVAKALKFFEQILLPAHLYQFDIMDTAAFLSNKTGDVTQGAKVNHVESSETAESKGDHHGEGGVETVDRMRDGKPNKARANTRSPSTSRKSG